MLGLRILILRNMNMDTNINPTPTPVEPTTHTLPIEETLKSAWEHVHGFKGTFWLAMLIVILISVLLGIAQALVNPPSSTTTPDAISSFAHNIPLLALFFSVLTNILNVLFSDGLFYVALRRAVNLPIKTRMIFTVFRYPLVFKLIILTFIKFLIVIAFASMMLCFGLIIPASGHWHFLQIITFVAIICLMFYVFIRLSMCDLLILDKGVDPLSAIKLSYQATHGFSWQILWLIILQILIILISILPLGIGLIWSLPFTYLVLPTIYNRLIGISMKG